jgi:hypothetical protein
MRFLLACVLVAALASCVIAEDICLPKRHTAWVQQREFSSFRGHNEVVFKSYHDTANGKSRVEFFPRHHARHEEITEFIVNDFNQKLSWRGKMLGSTVHECGKFFIEGDVSGEPYCFARKADQSGSFFLGENYQV